MSAERREQREALENALSDVINGLINHFGPGENQLIDDSIVPTISASFLSVRARRRLAIELLKDAESMR